MLVRKDGSTQSIQTWVVCFQLLSCFQRKPTTVILRDHHPASVEPCLSSFCEMAASSVVKVMTAVRVTELLGLSR